MNIPVPPRPPLAGLWRARVAFVAAQGPTHALSVAYNDTVSLARVRFDLRRLHGRIDRALLGRRFNALPRAARTWFAAFVENIGSNTHAHLALRAPPGRAGEVAAVFAARRSPWAELTPRATHSLREVDDAPGWVRYAAEDLAAGGEWFLSDEFLPAHALPGG